MLSWPWECWQYFLQNNRTFCVKMFSSRFAWSEVKCPFPSFQNILTRTFWNDINPTSNFLTQHEWSSNDNDSKVASSQNSRSSTLLASVPSTYVCTPWMLITTMKGGKTYYCNYYNEWYSFQQLLDPLWHSVQD